MDGEKDESFAVEKELSPLQIEEQTNICLMQMKNFRTYLIWLGSSGAPMINESRHCRTHLPNKVRMDESKSPLIFDPPKLAIICFVIRLLFVAYRRRILVNIANIMRPRDMRNGIHFQLEDNGPPLLLWKRCQGVIHYIRAPSPHSDALAHMLPPSITMFAPLRCAPARLHKYTIVPAISSGSPSFRFGTMAAMFSAPPRISSRPLAILEGKKPGAMLLTRMCRGPSSTAKLRVK